MAKQITVNYYDKSCTQIVRVARYTNRDGALKAMARARAKGQASAFAGTRTAADAPTAHH